MSKDDGFDKHHADYWRREYERVQAWLQRIGDGRITVDPECLNPANVVPLAAWLATHMGEASSEFPDERERRERAEGGR